MKKVSKRTLKLRTEALTIFRWTEKALIKRVRSGEMDAMFPTMLPIWRAQMKAAKLLLEEKE